MLGPINRCVFRVREKHQRRYQMSGTSAHFSPNSDPKNAQFDPFLVEIDHKIYRNLALTSGVGSMQWLLRPKILYRYLANSR